MFKYTLKFASVTSKQDAIPWIVENIEMREYNEHLTKPLYTFITDVELPKHVLRSLIRGIHPAQLKVKEL